MNKLINSSWFVDVMQESKIVILDGGARGDLFHPFNKVNSSLLQVIKVEPDTDANVSRASNEIVLNKAIWDSEKTISIHIANEPSVSSVYPPNLELASRFVDVIGKPARTTKKIVEVEADSIDKLFEKAKLPYPDFIKLDIHGCELEALSGALKSLEIKTIALIVESWVIEAHHDQKLLFSTDQLLHQYGFYPHDTNTSRWDYKDTDKLYSKPQAVISESLYFKDVVHRREPLDRIQGIKLVAIAELFGYTGFALLLTEYLSEIRVLDEEELAIILEKITLNNKLSKWSIFKERLRKKIMRMLTEETF